MVRSCTIKKHSLSLFIGCWPSPCLMPMVRNETPHSLVPEPAHLPKAASSLGWRNRCYGSVSSWFSPLPSGALAGQYCPLFPWQTRLVALGHPTIPSLAQPPSDNGEGNGWGFPASHLLAKSSWGPGHLPQVLKTFWNVEEGGLPWLK